MTEFSFFNNKFLVLSVVLSIAIASTEVPLWICLFSFLLIFWKYLNEKYKIYKLPVRLTSLLGLCLFAIVYLQYRTILGQEESTIILLGLASITILNYKSERDNLFLVLLGFLILIIKLIFSLDFVWVIPALISFFGLWISLIKSSLPFSRLKFIANIALRSLPMTVILFVLFPRLILFQSQQPTKMSVQSGFSEELNPGRFSEIFLQNQMVFRAEFVDNLMSTDELYWRGAVLNISKGFNWHKGLTEKKAIKNPVRIESTLKYKVILEPSNYKNLFVLDAPAGFDFVSNSFTEYNYQTFSLNEVSSQQVQYSARALFNSNKSIIDDPVDNKKYLIYPDLPPKTNNLVLEIKNKYKSPVDRIEALKKFYKQKGFIYTFKPEFYRNNLDEFLFERKKGFCEHFAASFGTLARALGIPARVIVGYQGGVYNSLGHFWTVSQKDAHAWVEVGINDIWQRVDPTALVSPLRMSLGAEEFFALSVDEQILYSQSKKWRKEKNFENWINQGKFFVENLNYSWTIFLLNYDLQTQLEVLKKIENNSLASGFIVFIMLVFLYIRQSQLKKISKINHFASDFFLEVEVWANRQGIETKKSSTPLQVLENIKLKFPLLTDVLQQIKIFYIQSVYQKQVLLDTEVNLKTVKKKWKKAASQVSKSKRL